MSKPVLVGPDAQEELEAAVVWYDEQTGRREVGDALVHEVRVALERIGEAPTSFATAGDVPQNRAIRRCALRTFPYAVVFVEMDAEILVLALAHGRRRPGYWRSRG